MFKKVIMFMVVCLFSFAVMTPAFGEQSIAPDHEVLATSFEQGIDAISVPSMVKSEQPLLFIAATYQMPFIAQDRGAFASMRHKISEKGITLIALLTEKDKSFGSNSGYIQRSRDNPIVI